MNVNCPKCREVLELPKDFDPERQRFECPSCKAVFALFHGLAYPIRRTGSHVIQAGAGGARSPGDLKRHGKSVSRKCLIWGSCGLLCLLGLSLLISWTGSRKSNQLALMVDNLEEMERIHGTNSVPYVEARLNAIRMTGLAIKEALVKEHRAFVTRMERAGYRVFQTQYSDGELVRLFVVNTRTGQYGEMMQGLSSDRFSYPAWMPAEDAQEIWVHYYYQAMGESEEGLRRVQQTIDDLEEQLRKLKERERE